MRPAGVGQTSGCVNFVFARITACDDTWPSLARTSLLRKARGVTPLAESRFAPANHSAHCFGSSAPRRSKGARTAIAFGLGHNGKGLRASRESPDSGEPLAVRNADRGSDSPAVPPSGSLHVMQLPGASQWPRPPSGYPDVKPGREASAQSTSVTFVAGSWCWRGGDQAVLVRAVKTRGCAKPQRTSDRLRLILRSACCTGQVSPSGKGEGSAGPNRAVELGRRKCLRVAVVRPRRTSDPDAGEVAVRRFSSAERRATGLGPVDEKTIPFMGWFFHFPGK